MDLKKVKPKSYDHGLAPTKAARSKPEYPTISIDHEHLPEAKDWKIGKMYHIGMKVKMVGNSQSRYQNGGEYEIHHLGHDGETEAEDEEKEEEDKETDE